VLWIGDDSMCGQATGWNLQLPECLTALRRFSGNGSGGDTLDSTLDASATTEPLLDVSLEAIEPQDMDRGEGSGGDQHEAAGCSLVSRIRQLWEGQITSASSDEGGTQSKLSANPLSIDQLVKREREDRTASLRHHAASPRPAAGPYGIAPSSGGHHEMQLAAEAARTAAQVRQLESDARAANQAGGSGSAVELAVDLAQLGADWGAVARKRRAIHRHIIAASASSMYGSVEGLRGRSTFCWYRTNCPESRPEGMHLLHTGEYLPTFHSQDCIQQLEARVDAANARASTAVANCEAGFDALVHGCNRPTILPWSLSDLATLPEIACPVCFDDFTEDSYRIVCGNFHVLCQSCFKEQIKPRRAEVSYGVDPADEFEVQISTKCPICREDMLVWESEEEEEEEEEEEDVE
jgi:hypothetical protein